MWDTKKWGHSKVTLKCFKPSNSEAKLPFKKRDEKGGSRRRQFVQY